MMDYKVLEWLKYYHPITYEHCIRVGSLCDVFGKYIGLNDNEHYLLVKAGILHDIGKLIIPKRILDKKGILSNLEWELMKAHTILASLFVNDEKVYFVIKYHHKVNINCGYPEDSVEPSHLSRIIGVLDGFDAMTHQRAYHKVFDERLALTELLRCRGYQFDSWVVDKFIKFKNDYGEQLFK